MLHFSAGDQLPKNFEGMVGVAAIRWAGRQSTEVNAKVIIFINNFLQPLKKIQNLPEAYWQDLS